MNSKLLIICGPTATGKTELGIHLAEKFNGEIISADSRQVYQGLDIISGKDITKDNKLIVMNQKLGIAAVNLSVGFRVKDNIPVWLLDIVKVDYPFNVGQYRKLAKIVIDDVFIRRKLPVIVGGTGLYIRSLLKPWPDMNVIPDTKLRMTLSKLSPSELASKLRHISPLKYESMNESDQKNPRRLVRAIEIALNRGKSVNPQITAYNYDVLKIGLIVKKAELKIRINHRISKRLRQGAVEEIENLSQNGYDKHLAAATATGAKQLFDYSQGKLTLDEAIRQWKSSEYSYAKRQIVWFKKEKNIHWFEISDRNFLLKVKNTVKKWYTSPT